MDLTDALDQLGAVERSLVDVERDGRPARAVVLERAFGATAEEVWAALTDPERLPRWFAPVTGELRPGGRFQVEGNAGGTVERCDAPTSLAITWEYGEGLSWVEVDLAEAGGSTTLRLRHLAHPDPHWDTYGAGAVGIGWDLSLWGLALHLASGAAVDHEAVEAWSAGEDGRAFMSRCGDCWYDAEVAGGADPAEARARADRTVAFFTGQAELT
jgi:uncharacterized protein YndB with AHSA1/START domain